MKISELPQEIKEKALKYQREADIICDKKTDSLFRAFDWLKTEEGVGFWSEWANKEPIKKDKIVEYEIKTPAHYNNDKGSLYKVAKERQWNPYLFDIVKRLERSEKKGEFVDDLEKSIAVIQLWLKESKN